MIVAIATCPEPLCDPTKMPGEGVLPEVKQPKFAAENIPAFFS
jgi:hypothetical protein